MNILITGASSGIGEALAHYYAKNANLLNIKTLFLTGRNEERLTIVSQKCQDFGKQSNILIIPKALDVTDRQYMKNWIDEIEQSHSIDLVIANAGISGGTSFSMTDQPIDFESDVEIINTNVIGVMNTLHPFIPYMKKRSAGHLAIVSSVASYLALPGAAAYSSSKAAVRFYAEALIGKLKHDNIDVSVICPGFVESGITRANKFPMPFLMSAEKAADIIAKGIARKKNKIEFPLLMVAAIKLVSFLPFWIKRDIFSQLPEKHSH